MLAICAIIRDEAPYIAEWIEFHRLVGVERFYLYDDRSSDRTTDVIMEHDRNDIILHPYSDAWHFPEFYGIQNNTSNWYTTPQACAFHHFGTFYQRDVDWCAFIDVDEFLFHSACDTLSSYLQDKSYQCGIVTNWLVFGSNGHLTRPDGMVIENYIKRGKPGQPDPWGKHVKTIANCHFNFQWGPHGSHVPVFENGKAPITQDGHPNPWSMTPNPTACGLRLNHYYHKSKAEGYAKARKTYSNAPPGYPNPERVAAHDLNEVSDFAILRFVPALRKALTCD